MIEIIAKNYLEGALDSVPVFLELPEVPSEDYPTFPESFVLIGKVGGGKTNKIESASLAFQSYSTVSLYEAAALDLEVREAMESFVSLSVIGSAKLASNYNFTDTSTKRYRYQSVYDIHFKED